MQQAYAYREFFACPDDPSGVDGPHIFRTMNDMVDDLTRSSDADDRVCQLLLEAIPDGPKRVRSILKRLHPHMPELVLDKIATHMCRSDYLFCVDVDAMARRYTPTFVDTVPNHDIYISKCRTLMRSMGAYESSRKTMAKLYENACSLIISHLNDTFSNRTNGIDQRMVKEELRVSTHRIIYPTLISYPFRYRSGTRTPRKTRSTRWPLTYATIYPRHTR